MHLTATGRDLVHYPDAIGLYFTMCANFADACRTSEVWVARRSMADRIARHPLVNNNSVIVGNLEDAAPARDGLACFPTPIYFDDCIPSAPSPGTWKAPATTLPSASRRSLPHATSPPACRPASPHSPS
ncbi:hypothetical protein [Streptomyces sp. NPDC057280]|uniref:hypothetical protein n=1 Tax=Streptomyces sp. NPDC057280 TaxID=3346081 RepID=UPI0036320C6B